MLGNKWLVLAGAMILWAVFFYTMDRMIMEGQGLPVGVDLMPI